LLRKFNWGRIVGANDKEKRAKKATHMRHYRHELSTLRRAVTKLGSFRIDKRYRIGRALVQWQRELIADLGGEDNVSTQQRTLIELASMSKLILGGVDAWILSHQQPDNGIKGDHKSLITRDKKLLPVVIQRCQIADGLARYMVQLGLERRQKQVSLQDYIDEHYGNKDEDGKPESENEP